jgi:rhodanese-related sulfurtransferase
MELIDRDELKEKMDRGDSFKLVMVLNDWAFEAKHIPGSINISTPKEAEGVLNQEDEIVVYCSNESCIASITAYKMLKANGYDHVRRYAGGLMDWEDAGNVLEGNMVGES